MKDFSGQKSLNTFHFLYSSKRNLKLFPSGQKQSPTLGLISIGTSLMTRSLDRINFSRIICNTKLKDAQTHTKNFQMFKLNLEKAEEPEIKLPTSAGSQKKQENSRRTSTSCFIDYSKAFDCVDHNKLWKILQEMGIPDHLTCLLRRLYVSQKEQLELDMEQQTGSKLGKEYKAVYCHPSYLPYMQSTSCEMPGWMKLKLESRLPGDFSNLRNADDTTIMAESKEEQRAS